MSNERSETDQYILDSIHVWVWSGFYSPADVQEMIGDILEEDADEAMLRAAVMPEFQRKWQEERSWPKVTDFDRLEDVYAALRSRGVLCLHNAGYTMSDGHDDAADALSREPKDKFFGYCFYHGQDLERAVTGMGLMFAFDHVRGDVPDKIKVGLALKEELTRAGFAVKWNGTTEQRIDVPAFDWKRRSLR